MHTFPHFSSFFIFHHTWGMPHKDCKGPPVDFVNAGSKMHGGDDFKRKRDIPDFEFDDFGISRLTPSRNFKRDYDLVNDKEQKSTKQIDDTDGKNELDEEAILRDRLQQLKIEKRSWLKKKRIADLKRQKEIEEQQLDDLKRQSYDVDQNRENRLVRFAPSTISNAGEIGSSKLTTKSLKRMTRNVDQTPLDMLLGSVGTGREQIIPEMGLNQNRQRYQPMVFFL